MLKKFYPMSDGKNPVREIFKRLNEKLSNKIKKEIPLEEPLTELLERNAKMEVAVFLLENDMQEQGIDLLNQVNKIDHDLRKRT